jgi:hypothetical protein
MTPSGIVKKSYPGAWHFAAAPPKCAVKVEGVIVFHGRLSELLASEHQGDRAFAEFGGCVSMAADFSATAADRWVSWDCGVMHLARCKIHLPASPAEMPEKICLH